MSNKEYFGIPSVKCYERVKISEDEYDILVMDLLGPSLENQFQICRKQFSLKTIVMLALSMLSRIEFVHRNQIVHRLIKYC